MESTNPIDSILDALASKQRQGETSLIVSIKPNAIQDLMNALHDYSKLFAPVVRGLTDMAPIYATYERMRHANETRSTVLLLVDCQTIEEFREALGRLPIRHSSEWRPLFNPSEWDSFFDDGTGSN